MFLSNFRIKTFYKKHIVQQFEKRAHGKRGRWVGKMGVRTQP